MSRRSKVDQAILKAAAEEWRKVAFIIAKIVHDDHDLLPNGYDLVSARIVALVESGDLESQGDLSNWRRSEVRLRQQSHKQSR